MANILPFVRLFMVCREIEFDFSDETWSLQQPLHTVALPKEANRDFRHPELWFYSQLVGGVGTFGLSIRLRYAQTDRFLAQTAPISRSFSLNDRLIVWEEVFQMSDIPFLRPDLSEFVLFANQLEPSNGTVALQVTGGS